MSVGEVETGRRMAEAVLANADDPDATLALVEALVAQQDWEGVREFVALGPKHRRRDGHH